MRGIIYKHSIFKMGQKIRRALRYPFGRGAKIAADLTAAVERRWNKRDPRRSLPMKQQRALGLRPSVVDQLHGEHLAKQAWKRQFRKAKDFLDAAAVQPA